MIIYGQNVWLQLVAVLAPQARPAMRDIGPLDIRQGELS